jgi:hypothetical protein
MALRTIPVARCPVRSPSDGSWSTASSGPFSFGAPGAIEAAFEHAGFSDVQVMRVSAPVRMASAGECVRFGRESFGALHQMLASLSEGERENAWREIEHELSQFQTSNGFEGPCELIIAAGAAD